MNTTSFTNVIEGHNIYKKLGNFELNIEELRVPKGFATALIGENGAGKTTLLNILSGIRLDAKGDIRWFETVTDIDAENTKERIGYTGPGHYYLPSWTVRQVRDITGLLFDNFHEDRFNDWCEKLAIDTEGMVKGRKGKKVSKLSDGNRMKLMLAGVLARDTELLLLDEPASPLDPLMRETLNDILRNYLAEGETPAGAGMTDPYGAGTSANRGNSSGRTVFFSTHNISDMERVTDYAIIMAHGKIMEQGFVEDLKEKYVLIKGDAESASKAKEVLFSFNGTGEYGYEGLCLAEDINKLAGLDVSKEVPTLFQISVAIMKKESRVQL